MFLFACAASSQTRLLPKEIPGTTAKYSVTVSEIDYAGAGTAKTSGHSGSKTPVQIVVASADRQGAKLDITQGPHIINGRSVGRAKIHQLGVDRGGSIRGASPAFFSVPFPAGGASVGQAWKAGLYGPAPLPGGLTASYRLQAISGPFAKIAMSIDQNGSCHVVGSGTLFVRVADGYVDHGKCNFDISYVRPDPSDRKKFNINSHNVLVCTVDQS